MKRALILFLIAIIILPATLAIDISIITEYDWQPPIHYEVSQGNEIIVTGASDQQNFSIDLLNGRYNFYIWLEQNQLPYLAGSSTIFISSATSEISPYLAPVGTLTLTFESKDHIPINKPYVRIDCGKPEYYRGDEFGSITTVLPAHECFIQAAYKDTIHTQTIKIVQGELTTQKIILDVKLSKLGPWLIIIGTIIILIMILIIIKTRSLQKKITPAEQSLHNLELLAKKEQTVINFLIEKLEVYEGKPNTFYVNQSAIIHEAGIPKTSLARILTSLETKKLITVEKIGKAKRIYLNLDFIKKKSKTTPSKRVP